MKPLLGGFIAMLSVLGGLWLIFAYAAADAAWPIHALAWSWDGAGLVRLVTAIAAVVIGFVAFVFGAWIAEQ